MSEAKLDLTPIYSAIERMMNAAGADWVELARKAAPVRKAVDRKHPGARAPKFDSPDVRRAFTARVRLASAANLKSSELAERRTLASRTSRQRAQYLSGVSAAELRRVAKFFQYTEGPNKGKSPEVLVVKGARVAGAEVTRGGTLRDSIDFVPAVIEGNRVTVMLRAMAPHAASVEFGFKHKGGEQIPGKAFMRGPLHSYILPGIREGRYNRG